jgi:pimeloyl-ACP methyl ester carboxylesterase
VLLGGATVAGIETNILPGRSTFYRAFGLDGPKGVIPKITPGPIVNGSFVSAARLGKTSNWELAYPPGSQPGDKLPVLIALHGYHGSHRSMFGDHLGLEYFLAQAVKDGVAPFAIAAVDGGNSYWHKRVTGEDSAGMVVDEFLPLLGSRGLDVSRVGMLGFSMGGFGALHIAGLIGAPRCRVVVAESPALWTSYARAARGAFDGAADFAANTPFGKQTQLDGMGVIVDCGQGDGFYPTAEKYVAGFAHPVTTDFPAGGHNDNFWRRMAPAQMRVVGERFG